MKKRINLLPEAEQQENSLRNTRKVLIKFVVVLIASVVLLALLLFFSQMFLRGELRSAQEFTQRQIEEVNQLEEVFLQDEARVLNENLENFQILRKEQQAFSPTLTELARLLSGDMVLDQLEIDAETGMISAAGRALDRDSVLAFRRRLLDSDFFSRVNFPLKNLEQPTDLSWEFDFFINPEKLKKENE